MNNNKRYNANNIILIDFLEKINKNFYDFN